MASQAEPDTLHGVIRLLLICALASPFALAPAAASACPEIIVPLNSKDSAFKSRAWRKALTHYKHRHHKRALKALRKMSRALEKTATRLFHPPDQDKAVKNVVIQRWLKKHVYTPHPGVIIRGHRFTYPQLVWWAWADTACRAGAWDEAAVALHRLGELRPGADLLYHRILIKIRRGKAQGVRPLLRKAPPDGFLTPYVEGLLAGAAGKTEEARKKLLQARGGADLEDRRKAVDSELKALDGGKDG